MIRRSLLALLAVGCAPRLPPAPPPALLVVECAPAEALVFVDQRLAGVAADSQRQPLAIPPGSRQVEIRAAGYFTAYRELSLGPGQSARLVLALRADPDAPTP